MYVCRLKKPLHNIFIDAQMVILCCYEAWVVDWYGWKGDGLMQLYGGTGVVGWYGGDSRYMRGRVVQV